MSGIVLSAINSVTLECPIRSDRSPPCNGIRLQFGGGCLKVHHGGREPDREAGGLAKEFVDFGEAGAELVGFELQQTLARLACVLRSASKSAACCSVAGSRFRAAVSRRRRLRSATAGSALACSFQRR